MAWSLPIWKIFGFPKVSLYLERFVLKHATAHIQERCATVKKKQNLKIYNMKYLLLPLLILMITSCENDKTKKQSFDNFESKSKIENVESLKIEFDNELVSSYKIEDEKRSSVKALAKPLSKYTTNELKKLPNSVRLTLSIVVPFDITKESLSNTFKSIASEKIYKDNDIDEIMIFAYDDKNDIGQIQYTFGKFVWAPYGKTGKVTPYIAKYNVRDNYKFDIIIKDKVGNIDKSDIPTARDLEIYNEIMSEKYWDMQEDESEPIIVKKFKLKNREELKEIWLKVASYKY